MQNYNRAQDRTTKNSEMYRLGTGKELKKGD